MFKLTLLDIEGNELKLGDWVHCMNVETRTGESRISFYMPISIKDNTLVPFDTHCWNYIKKIRKEDIPVEVKELGNEIEGYVSSGETTEFTAKEIEKFSTDYHINLWYNKKHHGYKIELLLNPENIQLELF